VSQKERANFETVYLEIMRIDFDDIWQKYSKESRIKFACFSFRVSGLKDEKFMKKQTYTKTEACKLYSRVF